MNTNTSSKNRPSNDNKKKKPIQQQQQQPKRRRRRQQHRIRLRVRPCVWRLIITVPTVILVIEWWIGSVTSDSYNNWWWFSLGEKDIVMINESGSDSFPFQILDLYQPLQNPYDKLLQRASQSIPILNLTRTQPLQPKRPREKCPSGLHRMIYLHNPKSYYIPNHEGKIRSRIPKIVHQMGYTRCLTSIYSKASHQWLLPNGGSYYFHDSIAMHRLLQDVYYPEFPQLHLIVQHCLHNKNNSVSELDMNDRQQQVKLALWQFVVLWMYGGIYADLNVIYTNDMLHILHHVTISSVSTAVDNDDVDVDQDAILIFDSKTNLIRLDFIAITPRHPLMYYTVQYLIINILHEQYSNARELIRAAFQSAMEQFHLIVHNDHQDGENQQQSNPAETTTATRTSFRNAKIYSGPHNRSVTVLGMNESPRKYLKYVTTNDQMKKHDYARMKIKFDINKQNDNEQLYQLQRWNETSFRCFHLILKGDLN